MRLSINFLQTGGVPLTADLMDLIQEQIRFYDFLGELAGNLTILSGCVVTGSSISSGVVAINGECYFLEAGLITSTVYINTQQITKTFQDQTDKILIEKKTVKFGTSTPANMWNWSEFTRLDSLKVMQDKISKKAEQTTVLGILERVMKLEIKTAPIQNGGVAFPWFKPKSEIPFGWKECLDTRGKTIVGIDPNDVDLQVLKNTLGAKKHTLTINEMPSHDHDMPNQVTIGGYNSGTGGNQTTVYPNYTNRRTGYSGGGQSHNNMQPSILAYYIEPDFQ
jgi:hypothetical protein